jgi:hypothetical protein
MTPIEVLTTMYFPSFRTAHGFGSQQELFESFNKKWLEYWRVLIRAVDLAEDALAVAINAAMAENVTLTDLDSKSGPYEPYGVDWFDEMMIKDVKVRRGYC